jgi:hypothetical protein
VHPRAHRGIIAPDARWSAPEAHLRQRDGDAGGLHCADIGAAAVGASEIGDGSVGSAEVADDSITATDTAPSLRLRCPAGTRLILGGCIEVTDRTTATFGNAEADCVGESRRLPSVQELRALELEQIPYASPNWAGPRSLERGRCCD